VASDAALLALLRHKKNTKKKGPAVCGRSRTGWLSVAAVLALLYCGTKKIQKKVPAVCGRSRTGWLSVAALLALLAALLGLHWLAERCGFTCFTCFTCCTTCGANATK
jgi:isoprenylcysteine carboxyl methyltransferase (ICMT) family protein YpbQ